MFQPNIVDYAQILIILSGMWCTWNTKGCILLLNFLSLFHNIDDLTDVGYSEAKVQFYQYKSFLIILMKSKVIVFYTKAG